MSNEIVTEEKFEAYEKVRQSGVTNMFNREVVCELADLTKDEYLYILKHYDDLNKRYPEVRAEEG